MGTGWFLIMVIIGIILLIITSVFSAIGAGNANNSSIYASNANVRNAGKYLTIAAIIGWSCFAVLLTIILVAFFTKAFSFKDFTAGIVDKNNPTQQDVVNAVKTKEAIQSAKTTSTIIFVLLIIISLLVFTIGILCAIAATNLGKVTNRDDKAQSAYTQSIVGAVLGIGTVGIMIVALIAYGGIRANRKRQLEESKAIIANSGATTTTTTQVSIPGKNAIIDVGGKKTVASTLPKTKTS